MEVIEYQSNDYPALLRYIKNPPKQLYIEGNKKILNQRAISIIGSRECSTKGRQVAKEFAFELARQAITIVSGMALRN